MSGAVRDWRCTAERGFSVIGSRYVLTEKALAVLGVVDDERPNPFGSVVKPRCRHCRQELSECPGGCPTGTGDRR